MTARNNPITGEPVLFAPSRADRPHAFGHSSETGERCPFCPGHESDTPPEIVALGDPWRMRVFPNKYPPADGAEVIVESRDHDAAFGSLDHAAEVVALYRERLTAHRRAAYASLFRNEGWRAGASIPHLHSQIVPLPFVPARVAEELRGFQTATKCPLCRTSTGVIIAESRSFLWMAPQASRMPYQQWVLPKRHVPSITGLDDAEIEDLASVLRSSAAATSRLTDGYNWAFMNFAEESAHFYIDVMPRLTAMAGLELGTGTFVQIIDPAAAAGILGA